MKVVLLVLTSCFTALVVHAQQANKHVITGNKMYHQKKYEEASTAYNKAIQSDAKNAIVNFNAGDAYYRMSKFDEAIKTFDKSIGNSAKADLKQKAFYNKGVSLSRQNKLEESIEAYKNAVKMNPADSDARVNLQKALLELKKKTPPPPEKKEDKKKQQQDKKPQQRESKLTKKEVEQRLKALQEREQQVQRKMQQRNRTAGQQEKDW